jgi:hypothetical protein
VGLQRVPHALSFLQVSIGAVRVHVHCMAGRIKQQLLQIIVQVSRQKLGRKHNEKKLVTSCRWEGAAFCSKHGNSITCRKSSPPPPPFTYLLLLWVTSLYPGVSWLPAGLLAVRRTSGVNKFVRDPKSGLYCAWRCGLKALEQVTRILNNYNAKSGPGSVVGIATGYGLDSPGIESRWERDFSAPVQTDPGSQTALCTMGTCSFPG